MITPQTGGAVYAQLAAVMRDEILTGRLRPGQRLPSETTLVQRYGVARQTARRAVSMLRAEGLVIIERGRGAVVREPSEVQDLQPEPGSTVSARMPTPAERAELALDDGVPVFEVTAPGADGQIYPADRWRLRWPQGT
jgi:DNA-binding GntR family transcriptional regulator